MRSTFYTRDAAFLDSPAHAIAVLPTKFGVGLDRLVADGLDDSVASSLKSFVLASRAVVSGLDASTLHAD